VRVFYALGDGETPFKISIANIFINVILDYFLVKAFATPGLVFATIGVNIISLVLMLAILNRRLNGLPLGEWGMALLGLTLASVVAGSASRGVSLGVTQWLGTNNLFLQLLELSLAVAVAAIVFGVIALQLKLPEVEMLVSRVKQKFVK